MTSKQIQHKKDKVIHTYLHIFQDVGRQKPMLQPEQQQCLLCTSLVSALLQQSCNILTILYVVVVHSILLQSYILLLYNIRAPRSKFVGTTRKERTKIFVSSARFFVSVASGKGNHYDEPSDKILGCENRLLYRSHKILCYSSQAIFNMPDIYYITENAASNCCCCCCWYYNGTLVLWYSKNNKTQE